MTTLTEEQFDDAFRVGTLENFDGQRVKLLQDNYPDLYRLIKDGDHIQTLNDHNHLKATLFAMGIIDDSMLKQSMLPESNWDTLVKHVWTVIEGEEDDGLYALPGVHINSVYYIVTDKPWTPDIEEAVYMAPDNDLEEEDEYDLEDELAADNESGPIPLSILTNTAKNTQDLNVVMDVEIAPTALTIAQAEEDARIVVHQGELGLIDAASTIVKNDGSVIQRVVLNSNYVVSPTDFDKNLSVGYIAFPPSFSDIITDLKDKILFSGGAITTIEATLDKENSPTLFQLDDKFEYDGDVIDTPQGMPFDVQLMAFGQVVDFKITTEVMGLSVTSSQINVDVFIDKATLKADKIVEVAFEKVEKKPKPSGPGMM